MANQQNMFPNYKVERPLRGGVMISNESMRDKEENELTSFCTLGLIVERIENNTTKYYGLTSNKLLNKNINEKIGQPNLKTYSGCCTRNRIGFSKPELIDEVTKTALIALDSDIIEEATEKNVISDIIGLGYAGNTNPNPVREMEVRKVGAASGFTSGIIRELDSSFFLVEYVRENENDKRIHFSDTGDEGAVVLDENKYILGVIVGKKYSELLRKELTQVSIFTTVAQKFSLSMFLRTPMISGQPAIPRPVNGEWKAWPGNDFDKPCPLEIFKIVDIFGENVDFSTVQLEFRKGEVSVSKLDENSYTVLSTVNGIEGQILRSEHIGKVFGIRYFGRSASTEKKETTKIILRAQGRIDFILYRTVFRIMPYIRRSGYKEIQNKLDLPNYLNQLGVSNSATHGINSFNYIYEVIYEFLPHGINWKDRGTQFIYEDLDGQIDRNHAHNKIKGNLVAVSERMGATGLMVARNYSHCDQSSTYRKHEFSNTLEKLEIITPFNTQYCGEKGINDFTYCIRGITNQTEGAYTKIRTAESFQIFNGSNWEKIVEENSFFSLEVKAQNVNDLNMNTPITNYTPLIHKIEITNASGEYEAWNQETRIPLYNLTRVDDLFAAEFKSIKVKRGRRIRISACAMDDERDKCIYRWSQKNTDAVKVVFPSETKDPVSFIEIDIPNQACNLNFRLTMDDEANGLKTNQFPIFNLVTLLIYGDFSINVE